MAFPMAEHREHSLRKCSPGQLLVKVEIFHKWIVSLTR
jgi:hypothetical protein